MQLTQQRFLRRHAPPHISTLIILSGISALGINVFVPSLPGMAAYFNSEYATLQLAISLYLATNAVIQILVGPLSDKWGRRPVLLAGIGVFLLATLGCIYAPSAEVFLGFRMAQASVVVAMVISRASVRDLYDQDSAASMIGYVTMGMAVVPMVAPAIGGVLDETLGWQANFWLLFLAGAVAFVLVYFDFGETAYKSGKSIVAQFREYPLLFTSPRFWGYSLASALTSGTFFAYLGGAPFVGQAVYGLSTTELGFFMSAPAIGYFAGNFASGRYSTQFGINRMTLWGCLTNGIGVTLSIMITLLDLDTATSFFGLMIFIGIGNGLSIPNATAGALSVRPHLAGTASGLSGAIMLGGGAALSAIAGTMLNAERGALPLLILMGASGLAALITIILVLRRERQLGL
ncbi:multidrug effflux MFS transporter [Epibacterium ulvae]|uniref:multidrug effflux MFS transporter n=1 Tax=Epibacterium ulvae TaxID=1156985 RepID=UPI002491CEBD|nr:multidrug effflux MFS transporter [Epibacterium ulvae]